MPLTLDWSQFAARLFFTILAGALIGWDRGEHGHPAGLRTTLLVCLAASVAMIETNALLGTRSKPEDSFVVLDLMRLPLGILSGMGFIGAGAIIRRGDMVQGVTTAATLWFVTVIGLCFGAGDFQIGIVSTAVGFIVLSLMKRLEEYLPIDRSAVVELTVEADSSAVEALADGLAKEGYRLIERASSRRTEPPRRQIRYELQWRAPAGRPGPSGHLERLAASPGVVELAWQLAPLPDTRSARPPIS